MAATQQNILALQQMQENTARLHAQYLAGQEAAQKAIHALMEQQMRLMGRGGGAEFGGRVDSRSAGGGAAALLCRSRFQRQAECCDICEAGYFCGGRCCVEERIVCVPSMLRVPRTLSMAHRAWPGCSEAQTVLLEVVADKTGYPVEMLELDMRLDSDLGIDSIKRVEILSALQARLPAAPVVKPEDLGRLQTLRQIVAFLEWSGKHGARACSAGRTMALARIEMRGAPLSMAPLDTQVAGGEDDGSMRDGFAGGDCGDDGVSGGDAGVGYEFG